MIANMELKRNVSRTSCKNRLRMLSSYYEFLQDEGVICANPVKKFGDYKLAKRQKEAFSEMELEKIRRAIKTKKEKAILELLLSTGCRVSELVGIKKQEIKGEEILVHGKGQKDRIVIMNARARLAVDEYIDSQGETARNSKWLFPAKEYIEACKNPEDHMKKGAVELMCRKWGEQIGVKAYPHKFRRTCATMALRHGMDLIYVSKMLGHESTETTQIYLDLEVETMKEQHRKYVT
jgi:integrase/recombinase XerD